MRVLIVEDEADLGAVFKDYIDAARHHADVVGSAEAALERLHTSRRTDHSTCGSRHERARASEAAGAATRGSRDRHLRHATEHQAAECLRLGAWIPRQAGAARSPRRDAGARPSCSAPPRTSDAARAAHDAALRVSLPVRIVNEQGQGRDRARGGASATGLRARSTRRCGRALRCAWRSLMPISAARWTSSPRRAHGR